MRPFFSIIIPSYNRASFLGNTLNSVLLQEFEDWECLVVDDGSTDNTEEVVKAFKDRRIRYFYKENEERSIARNFGISKALGKYICFLDSDDLYYKNHLQVLYENIEKERFPAGLFTTGMNVKKDGVLNARPVYDPSKYDHPLTFIWEKFLLPTSVCIHSSILEQHKFPRDYKVWEDTHLFLRVAADFPFYQIDEVTTQWNVHKKGSVSRAFDEVNSAHVIQYLECIKDLFQNYKELISPYLDSADMKAYQLKKWRMFTEITYYQSRMKDFMQLYLYGLKNLDIKEVQSLCAPLILRKIRKKIISYSPVR
ncbi:glycosyltransferase family 2 protein [Salegentibacter chungangensis]|uniref:Glycosyltransferase family 2 protein n=1 Tax=Salegentibacter chungangensis TaxID=1335724 RepID=A0ABW3NQC8_9FLAO